MINQPVALCADLVIEGAVSYGIGQLGFRPTGALVDQKHQNFRKRGHARFHILADSMDPDGLASRDCPGLLSLGQYVKGAHTNWRAGKAVDVQTGS